MKRQTSSSPFRRQEGVALIIILCFVVLLTGLGIAYFSRSMSDRQLSNSSYNQAKAENLARGAANIIIGDLKQEIVNGSTAPITAGNDKLYFPSSNANMVPMRSGNPPLVGGVDPIPNLIRRSVKTDSIPNPGVASRASAVNSETDVSLNGRFINKARWNRHYLISRLDMGTSADSTPDAATNFTAPDWVFVSALGTQVITTPSTSIQGRYAYAIYDEGGLLDINAAGYPADTTSGGPNGLSDVQKSRKMALPLANLSVLPTNKKALLLQSGGTYLPQDQVNNIVGWRNYASAGLTASNGTYKNFTFDPTTANLWLKNFVTNSNNGYLKVWTGVTANPARTDQAIINRQQLLELRSSLGFSQNALQYMGTFSRTLDQPSFRPNPGRPKILSNLAADNYAGNDAAGHDDEVNPSFLTVRVATTVPGGRNDGSDLTAGEPLVKKRFALNRLAWLTYLGPSAGRNTAATSTTGNDADIGLLKQAGLTKEWLDLGTGANIQKYFGLTWDSTTKYWTYAHGITGSTGQPIIGYLDKVIAASREPDFFELLKTSINAGSIAKGATNPASADLVERSAYIYDTKTDYAILQIVVNIIDQFDCDGYPTRVRFTTGGTTSEFRGVENLPYFYRIREGLVFSRMPNPLPSKDTKYDPFATKDPYPPADEWTSPDSLKDTGLYSIFVQPEIWNPHDTASSLGNPRPSNFRAVADAAPLDDDGNPLAGTNTHRVAPTFLGADPATGARLPNENFPSDANSNTPDAPNHTVTWQGDNTALTFTDAGGTLFREPTLLVKANVPAGSNLALGPNNLLRTLYMDPLLSASAIPSGGSGMQGVRCLNETNPASNAPYLGFYFGEGPLRWVFTQNTKNYIATSNELDTVTPITAGSAGNTYRMQYSPDGGTTWVTYDEKYMFNMSSGHTFNVKADGSQDVGTSPSIGNDYWVDGVDPRSRRFGNPVSNSRAAQCQPPLDWSDQNNMVLKSSRPTAGGGVDFWWGGAGVRGFATVGGWFTDPTGNWLSAKVPPPLAYMPSLLSQNNHLALAPNPPASSKSSTFPLYYADPDGVVRRAMGGYVPVGGSGQPATTTVGLPMAYMGSGSNPSRPIVLNRPFRSVAELGYVFSGSPWKNLSFFTPESGATALLDVFCITPNDNPDSLVAGKVNLNTRQRPVLKAILAGAYADEFNSGASTGQTAGEADAVAGALITLTSGTGPGQGPLTNISDLVGRWNSNATASQGGIDGAQSYSGLSAELTSIWGSGTNANPARNNIQRFREAPIRALAACGQTRVWNLMIDVIAQTGRYPINAPDLSKFIVDGERRYWVHVAIDRFTGRVIDEQVEAVQE